MAWIQVTQHQMVEPAPPPATTQYRLRVAVDAAQGIEPQLFVVATTDDLFSHVATVADLSAYPPDKATAQARESLFYRVAAIDLLLTTQTMAVAASDQTQARLSRVVRDWGAVSEQPFGGVATFVYDSDAA